MESDHGLCNWHRHERHTLGSDITVPEGHSEETKERRLSNKQERQQKVFVLFVRGSEQKALVYELVGNLFYEENNRQNTVLLCMDISVMLLLALSGVP